MVLSDIKRYLQDRQQATLSDLILHFDTDAAAMRGMLDQWIQKGKVERCDLRATCGKGCSTCGCDDISLEMYAWRKEH